MGGVVSRVDVQLPLYSLVPRSYCNFAHTNAPRTRKRQKGYVAECAPWWTCLPCRIRELFDVAQLRISTHKSPMVEKWRETRNSVLDRLDDSPICFIFWRKKACRHRFRNERRTFWPDVSVCFRCAPRNKNKHIQYEFFLDKSTRRYAFTCGRIRVKIF